MKTYVYKFRYYKSGHKPRTFYRRFNSLSEIVKYAVSNNVDSIRCVKNNLTDNDRRILYSKLSAHDKRSIS